MRPDAEAARITVRETRREKHVELIHVRFAIIVRVRVESIDLAILVSVDRLAIVGLDRIRNSVAVRVGVARVGADRGLDLVAEPVIVAVRVDRVDFAIII